MRVGGSYKTRIVSPRNNPQKKADDPTVNEFKKLLDQSNKFTQNSDDIKKYITGVKALIENFESDNTKKLTDTQKKNLLTILKILHNRLENQIKEKPNSDTIIYSKLELLVFLSSKMGSDSSTIQGSRVEISPLARIQGWDRFFKQGDIDEALKSEVLNNRPDLKLLSINIDDIATFSKSVAEIIKTVNESAKADKDVKTNLKEGVEATLETIKSKANHIETKYIPEFTKSVAEIIKTVNESAKADEDVKTKLKEGVEATLKKITEKAKHIETKYIPEFTKSVAEIITAVKESEIKDDPDVKTKLTEGVIATLETITKKAADIETANIPEFTKSVAEIITAVKESEIKDDPDVKTKLEGVVNKLPEILRTRNIGLIDPNKFIESVQALKNTATDSPIEDQINLVRDKLTNDKKQSL